jgi:hypothetical protein
MWPLTTISTAKVVIPGDILQDEFACNSIKIKFEKCKITFYYGFNFISQLISSICTVERIWCGWFRETLKSPYSRAKIPRLSSRPGIRGKSEITNLQVKFWLGKISIFKLQNRRENSHNNLFEGSPLLLAKNSDTLQTLFSDARTTLLFLRPGSCSVTL